MRSSLLLSILIAAVAGGCNQSLTGNMTGTGGVTGTGGFLDGAGGFGGTGTGGDFGTGGMGGSITPAACATLQSEFQSALTAAETCQVGAPGQCQQLVNSSLSGCNCQTYVSDGSALAAIDQAWQAAGCNNGTRPPCEILCPAALNTTCVSADGGSVGFCSYDPGTGGSTGAGGGAATGGTSGAGGTGGTGGTGGSTADGGVTSCAQLATEYAAVLEGAKTCTAGAPGQCTESVPAALSPCSPCNELVDDRSVLDILRMDWTAAGCGNVAVSCPLVTCPVVTGASCLPGDAGGSVCSPVHPIATG
jgi:hypothetical protein